MGPLEELVGESRGIAEVRETVRRLLQRQASSRRPASVLILGETGVGKGLLASILHRAGPRPAGPFVEVNCAAIPEPLLEAELFGFERGAFTDAKQAKPGLFQAADGGTLFLDEIGLLPGVSQGKLLKALEDGVVRRLGTTRSEPVDVWVIAATSEDLEAAARERRFRSDLYHRLAVLTLRLPPLRERGRDILVLAERFLVWACSDAGVPPKVLTEDARTALLGYDWPGNIRELKNVIARAVLLSDTSVLASDALGLPGTEAGRRARAGETKVSRMVEHDTHATVGTDADEHERLASALRETSWNISRAAALLGLTRSMLRYRIDKHGLTPDRAERRERPLGTGDESASQVPPNNLPQELTSFVGREREILDIKHHLATGRLLTLTGTGGAGKTRLALSAAADLLPGFPDGVWLVELAALADPGLVAQAIASALHVREEADRAPLEAAVAALARKRLLLILDNCEHLIAACVQCAAALLRGCPELRILATSRERLNVAGESTLRVPSLAHPDDERIPLDRLGNYEAVRLFVERARGADGSFALTEQNAMTVVRVCRRLDGIPLALELAAARVRHLTVEQIDARLDDRFLLLTGGTRTVLPRQQTLRAAFDWSHDLLSGAEQVLFRRLSVFAGGFTIEAAEAACSGTGVDEVQVLDLLSRLVDKSLVIVETLGGEARYRLLESTWEYSRERALAAGEVPMLRGRHRDWYLAFAERAEAELRGAEQVVWLDRLETEYDNLQTALGWRDQGPSGDEARLRLAAALWRFWEVRGRVSEGCGWLEGILSETGHESPAARARALNGAGNLARDQGNYRRATEHHQAALTLRREVGDMRGIATSLNNLGTVAHDTSRYSSATALFEEAIPVWRAAGDQQGLALSLNNLGRTLRFQGHYARAAALCEESLALFQHLRHPWGIARALNSLANSSHYQGDLDRALALYGQSLDLRRKVGDRHGIGVSLNSLGVVSALSGDLERATALCEEGLALRRDLGDRRGLAVSLLSLATIALRQGNLDRAEALCCDSLLLRRDLGDVLGTGSCLEGLADVALLLEHYRRAVWLLAAAGAARDTISAPLPPVERGVRERSVTLIKAALGENAFRAAWTEGGGTPLDQAVAKVLEESSRMVRS